MISHKIKRRSKRKRRRRLVRLAVVLLLLFLAVRYFESQVSAFTKTYLPTFARQVTTKAVCAAVEEVLAGGEYSYDKLAEIVYDKGRVNSVKTDPQKINLLKTRVVSAAESKIDEVHNSTMHIPLGAFTNLTLLSNRGPKIPLSYCVTGSFQAELKSEFESAGVNQTVHHIKLIVTSHVVTASVDYEDAMDFSTDFEVAQSVIVGEIPTTYGGYFTAIR